MNVDNVLASCAVLMNHPAFGNPMYLHLSRLSYSSTYLFLDVWHSFSKRDDAALFLRAQLEFDAAFLKRAPADDGSQWQADVR